MGLQEIHEAGILHCDIKLENILVENKNGVLHVDYCDFGSACWANSVPDHVWTTPIHRPPETISGGWSEKADIFQLGLVIAQLFTGQHPIYGSVSEAQLQNMDRATINAMIKQFWPNI